jgi:hypothetical protein
LDFSAIIDVEYPTGDQIPNDVDRNTVRIIKVDTTARGVNSALINATSITLTTAANASYYRDGDPLTITNDTGANKVTQTNWASADGNTTTGVLTLKNVLSSALSTTPTVAKANHFRFLEDTPTSSNIFTIKYGIPHTLTDTSNTLPTSDCRAFCHLCASLTAYAISAKFAQRQDSSFSADAVNYESKAEEWRNVAEDQRKIYNDFFGITDEDGASVPAAGSLADTDFIYQHGMRFLFHGGRYR